MSVLLLILGLVLFVALVVVHEFGHYLAARRNGVEVEEFGIGFPPRAWKKRLKNGVLLTINWLPLGGFVKLKGEHDADTEKGSFGAANLWAKTKIMLAGVVMNLIAAFLLLTVVAGLGMPQLINNQFTVKSDTKIVRQQVLVGYVEPGSPAAKAGLRVRDQLFSFKVNLLKPGQARCLSLDCGSQIIILKNQEELPKITQQHPGQLIEITYKRGNQTHQTIAQLRSSEEVDASLKTGNPKGYLGISPTQYTLARSTWSAPIVALGLIKQLTLLTFQGLGHALGALLSGQTAKASEQVAGPVGIFVLLKDSSKLGYQFILLIVAVISLTLAIMNVLPIPALDGGRLFVTWLYRLLHRPLTKRAEDRIHGTGFALLMVLFILITIVDVRRFL